MLPAKLPRGVALLNAAFAGNAKAMASRARTMVAIVRIDCFMPSPPCASMRCALGAIQAEGTLVELHPEDQVGALGRVVGGFEVAVVETADVVADADPGIGERREAHAGAERPGIGVLAPGVQDAGA